MQVLDSLNLYGPPRDLGTTLPQAWPALASLQLYTNNISSLALCTALKHLSLGSISSNTHHDLVPMASLSKLVTLELHRCKGAIAFGPHAEFCTRLTSLTLRSCSEVAVSAAEALVKERTRIKDGISHAWCQLNIDPDFD